METAPIKVELDKSAVPTPTRDKAQALKDIAEYGYAVIPEVLQGDVLKKTCDAFFHAAECDRRLGRVCEMGSGGYKMEEGNQRLWNVLNRDPLFEDLAFHPLVVEFVKEIVEG